MEFPVTSDVSSFDSSVNVLKRLQGVSFAYLNVCSVIQKFDDVRLLLKRSNIDFPALGEMFLNDSISDSELHVPGYHLHRSDRTPESGKKGGGGLLIYASEKYSNSLIYTSCSPNIEVV